MKCRMTYIQPVIFDKPYKLNYKYKSTVPRIIIVEPCNYAYLFDTFENFYTSLGVCQ